MITVKRWMLLIAVGILIFSLPIWAKGNQVCFGEHCFDVEVAEKPKEVQMGLQFRQKLAEDSGMLFIFPFPGIYYFWMKDTFIPLDIIWMDEEKKIIHIAFEAPPCREDICPEFGPRIASRYILEINAGLAKKYNIQVGDQARFEIEPAQTAKPAPPDKEPAIK